MQRQQGTFLFSHRSFGLQHCFDGKHQARPELEEASVQTGYRDDGKTMCFKGKCSFRCQAFFNLTFLNNTKGDLNPE